MEQNFQTSFIPKKPIIKEQAVSAQPVSLFLIIALLLLFTVLLTTGGLYFYKENLKNKIEKMEEGLLVAEQRFEPAKLSELQVLDQRLRAGSEILSKHVSVTPIFELLEELTIKNVRFTKFEYTTGEEKNAPIVVKMSGVAVGYRSIALQSDLFAGNKNIIDPVFSNLMLDQNANVLFDLDFSVDRDFVNYKQTIPADI